MEPRAPRGYLGIAHQTIGSDLLAISETLDYLVQQGELGPRGVLGKVLHAEPIRRLAGIEPNGWYPIEWLLSATDAVAERVGPFGLRRVGRTSFRRSHAEQVASIVTCGLDVVRGIDGMYHRANRGEAIGGWEVLDVDDNRAVLDKTTPHHCALEEGILAEALVTVACRAVVMQEQCRLDGKSTSCRFVIESLGEHWHPPDDSQHDRR